MPPKTKKKPEDEAPKVVKVQVSDDTIRTGLSEMALSLGSLRVNQIDSPWDSLNWFWRETKYREHWILSHPTSPSTNLFVTFA